MWCTCLATYRVAGASSPSAASEWPGQIGKDTVVETTETNPISVIHEPASLTIRMIDAFVSFMAARGAKKRTCVTYRSILLAVRTVLDCEPCDWTPLKWVNLLDKYRTSGQCQATLLVKQVALQQFFRFARNPENEFEAEILRVYGKPLSPPVTPYNAISHTSVTLIEPNVRPVTIDEVYALLGHLDGVAQRGSDREARVAAMMGCAIKVAVAFGLRSMELGSIRRRNCHAVAKFKQYSDFGRLDVIGKSKPYGSPRQRTVFTVPHFQDIVPVLEVYCGPDGPRGKLKDDEFLFVNERGKPISGNYFSKRFVHYCREIGLSHEATAHGMRRFYATRLYTLGVDLWFLSDQLGHENAETTLRYIRFATDFREQKVHEYQHALFSADR